MDIFVRVPKKDNAMAENQKMEIDLGEDVAQGNYINLAIIAHSVSEFIIDFATVLPGVPKAKVKSRVILTPEHAKRLLLSLQENITRYESNVGKIEIPAPQRHSPGDFPLGGGPGAGDGLGGGHDLHRRQQFRRRRSARINPKSPLAKAITQ